MDPVPLLKTSAAVVLTLPLGIAVYRLSYWITLTTDQQDGRTGDRSVLGSEERRDSRRHAKREADVRLSKSGSSALTGRALVGSPMALAIGSRQRGLQTVRNFSSAVWMIG
jgi:hypothetical protein